VFRGAAAAMIAGAVLVALTPADTDAASVTPHGTLLASEMATASTDGVWSSAFQPRTAAMGIHAVVLHTGKVLLWSGYLEGGQNGGSHAALFDPVTNAVTKVDPEGSIFCGGQTVLPDGQVLVVGGLGILDGSGVNTVYLFDPVSQTWTQQDNMRKGRWYPAVAEVPSGQAVLLGGHDENVNNNTDVEVYTPGSTASTLVGTDHVGNYSKTYLLPNGKLLVAAPLRTQELDPSNWTWTNYPNLLFPQYQYPSGVLLPGPPSGSYKVMIVGGKDRSGGTVTANTEIFDGSNPTAGWKQGPSMPEPRTNMNLVILPDGTLLGVGGASLGQYMQPQFQSLLFDPTANTWTPVATQTVQRTYHSTAVLLPDGRVLSAGDNQPGGGHGLLDIYSPPYLFKGARPTITSAPSTVPYGGSFKITTPDTITRAVLMAPGATSHATDTHQRHVELAITATSGGYTATTPSVDVAPPGYYMLFLLNAAGVPSVASWVHIGS
jgi:hypothetical protein